MTVSAAAARGDRLTVTGELGDQVFGSDKMQAAFKEDLGAPEALNRVERDQTARRPELLRPPPQPNRCFFDHADSYFLVVKGR